jgi:exodeoxyribonuclease VII small subunit
MSEESKEISFEENIKNAQQLLEKLIDPEITLSDSVAVYKEGLKELEKAGKLLEDAKLEFEELSQK